VGDHTLVKLEKVTKQKITGTLVSKLKGQNLSDEERKIDKLWQTIEEEA
jgi:hypothetical protein